MNDKQKQKVFDELQMAQEYIESGIACLNVARRELGEDKSVPGMAASLRALALEIEKNVGEPLDHTGLNIHSSLNIWNGTHPGLTWRNC